MSVQTAQRLDRLRKCLLIALDTQLFMEFFFTKPPILLYNLQTESPQGVNHFKAKVTTSKVWKRGPVHLSLPHAETQFWWFSSLSDFLWGDTGGFNTVYLSQDTKQKRSIERLGKRSVRLIDACLCACRGVELISPPLYKLGLCSDCKSPTRHVSPRSAQPSKPEGIIIKTMAFSLTLFVLPLFSVSLIHTH